MVSLVEIPFLMGLADYIWGEENAATCLSMAPFLSKDCFTQLIVKGLGISIIAGSFLNKSPIMFNILQSKSTAGLSRIAIYGELIVYANGAFYGLLQGHPFTAFGENLALMIQNAVIVFMTWQFTSNPQVSMGERMSVLIVAAAYVIFVTQLLPKDKNYLLMSSVFPILLYSRGTQVLETFRIKHSGANSIVTLAMNLSGSSARIFTTIKEVGWDMAVLTTFFVSCGLNLIMFIQYVVYRENTKMFMEELEKKKKE